MKEELKPIIVAVANNPENLFNGTTYKFGKKKPITRTAAMLHLVEVVNIPDQYSVDAIAYLDEVVKEIEAKKKIRMSDDCRPDFLTYVDGGTFPEFLEPIDMAALLFGGLEVATSGTLKFSESRGIPKWISRVNPSLTVRDRVKEHDIRAGVASEIRRYKKGRSEEEKKCQHTFTVDEVVACRDSVTSTIRHNTLQGITERIKYDKGCVKPGMKELERFIEYYHSPKSSDHSTRMHRLHQSMICHWIWLVKRRLNKLPTVYEIALVFLGRQGVGKSFSVRRMTEVVSDLSTPASVSNLVDERETRRWENYYIAFLDEISKESKDSLSKLKDWVTRTESEFRPLYSNSSEGCDKNAQAIGTSNFPLASILKDPSGMRRFWEIPSDQEKSKIFTGMETIDWELIYKAIDESNNLGYYGPDSLGGKFFEEITEIQNAARDKSPVEEYMYTENYVDIHGIVRDDIDKKYFSITQLREDFNIWTEMNGWGQYTPKAFRLELLNMHLELKRGAGNDLTVELNIPSKLKKVNTLADKEIGFND